MKIKMRPDEDDASSTSEWATMSGWLAELREDDQAEPDSGGGSGGTDSGGSAGADSRGHDETESQSHTGMAIRSHTGTDRRPYTGTDSRPYTGTDRRGHVQPASGAGPRAMASAPPNTYPSRRGAAARAKVSPRTETFPVRPLIGDELRMPTTWCEMGSCISWHADRAALGEADNRARAISAGWRIDALGRMTCPRCQQTSTSFRATRPIVPWDRATAIVMAARAAAGPRYRNTGSVPRPNGRGTRRPASGQR